MNACARTLVFGLGLGVVGTACSGASPGESDREVIGSTRSALGCAAVDNDHFEFMDDACKKKRLPTDRARTVSCPLVSTVSAGFAPSSSAAILDAHALDAVAPKELKVTVILIRRVDGVPIYRYLSNGTQDDIFQPWSSSKFMAAAAAGARLRQQSGGKVGLTGKTGQIPLGDLITVVASYREERYTSNGLGRYFLNVAGRPAVADLIHVWLQRPAAETYGGNYGAPAPDLGYTFTDANSASISVTPDESTGPANALSTRTSAEFLKRLAVWDDVATRLPGLAREDIETLVYGPTVSPWYPNELGGLISDAASQYLQNALDMNAVEKDSAGQWRTFGKLGYGIGSADREPALVDVHYACLPVLDAAKQPMRDRGAEFVIATRLNKLGTSPVDRDQVLARLYNDIIDKVVLPSAQTVGPYTDAGPDGGPLDPGSDGGKTDGQPDPGADGSGAEPVEGDEAAGCTLASAGGRGRSVAGEPTALGLLLAAALVVRRRRAPRRS